MRSMLLGVVLLGVAGCTALRTINGPPEQLRRDVAAGALLKAGDRVEVVTRDGRVHELVVTGIANGEIVARGESVPIDQLVTISKREFAVGPTAAVVGGIGAVILGSIIAAGNSHHHTSCQSNSGFCVFP